MNLLRLGIKIKLPESVPEGFSYYPDFLSDQEEGDLLKVISGIELHTFIFQGYTARRKVTGFGYDYNFENRKITKGTKIPGEFRSLIEKAALITGEHPDAFEELLITEYPEGAVINWHRDAPPFNIIAGISLLSNCRFRLRPHNKANQGRNAIVRIPVERRSLYVMKGSARNEWEHSIAAVKSKRYSITLRTLRNK